MTIAAPCPFCEYLEGTHECAFVSRTDEVAVFVNRSQFERGALLAVPVRHVADALHADPRVLAALHVEAARAARALALAFGASGINIFQNNGADAGQTVWHLHVHVVPRYRGSDPRCLFREADFQLTPIAELHAIALQVRGALDPA